MSIASAEEVTDRGWTEQDGLPPGFFFGGGRREAHLHLTLSLMGGKTTPPWQVEYLHFKGDDGIVTVIYDRNKGIDNPTAIDHLPAAGDKSADQVREEARWAYSKR